MHFLACDVASRNLELPASQSGSADLVLGKPQAQEFFDANSSRIKKDFVSSNKQLTLFPLGDWGNTIWSNFPSQLAMLVDNPLESSLIAAPANRFQNEAGPNLWQWMVEHSDEFRVAANEIKSSSIKDQFPDLVPADSSMPGWLRSACENLNLKGANSGPDSIAIKAGLFQIHGDLETSHEYAQDCQGKGRYAAGDYWHGIMHRREPDYGNSKYWFRRVGEHPIFDDLSTQASTILKACASPLAHQWSDRLTTNGTGHSWDPMAFVDLCETCSTTQDRQLIEAVRQIQWAEMMLLLVQTYRDAQ
ncbi:hypothetical protein [Thalassoglobus sp.]|uniref:hypothetical protein n=1 Tax=Thalassoglobus sp. TaxID=2795869 RepID=UPI003AA8017B